MDTSTVRLVIFLGMFLVFAGDYSALISTIFGKATDRNVTDVAKRPPEIGLKEHRDDMSILSKKNADKDNVALRRAKMITTIKTACLPKLICELSSSIHQDQLSEMERSLLNLIRLSNPRYFLPSCSRHAEGEALRICHFGIPGLRFLQNVPRPALMYGFARTAARKQDTSLSTMAEVPSRYHFAAHMGQLISGVEGQGCHNFYPTCPLARTNVLNMMKKVRLR